MALALVVFGAIECPPKTAMFRPNPTGFQSDISRISRPFGYTGYHMISGVPIKGWQLIWVVTPWSYDLWLKWNDFVQSHVFVVVVLLLFFFIKSCTDAWPSMMRHSRYQSLDIEMPRRLPLYVKSDLDPNNRIWTFKKIRVLIKHCKNNQFFNIVFSYKVFSSLDH